MKNVFSIRSSLIVAAVFLSLVLGAQAALIAQWNFNEGGGRMAMPAAGVSTGAVHGAATLKTEGESGCFHTPGTSTNDYMELGRGDAFNLTNRYSLEAWFRVNGGNNTMILGKHYSLFAVGHTLNSAGRYFEFYTGGGANSIAYGGVERDEWYHIVAAYDGSVTNGTNMWLFVNGALAASKLATNITLASNTGALMAAQSQHLGDHQKADADWDQVAVYDHALTADEVAARYNAEPVALKESAANEQNTLDVWPVPLKAEFWEAAAEKDVDQGDRSITDTMGGIRAVQEAGAEKAGLKYEVRDEKNGVVFEVAGDVPNRRSMKWSWKGPAGSLGPGFEYIVVRYKAEGIQRSGRPFALITAKGKAGKRESLLDCAQVVNDSRWHILVLKSKKGFKPTSFKVEVASQDARGLLAIRAIEYHKTLPENMGYLEAGKPEIRSGKLECVDLTSSCNDTMTAALDRILKQYGVVTDGGLDTSAKRIIAEGIPFRRPTNGNNLIRPAENKAINEEKVDLLGAQIPRRYFMPVGRDDRTEVKVGRKVSEVFFILVAEFPPAHQRYAVHPVPFEYEDVDASFAVELVYADGESDFAFPYSIADGRPVIRRAIGVYAVPCDEKRELKVVVLHNRQWGTTLKPAQQWGTTVGLAGVTLNTSPERVLPELVREPELVRVPEWPQPKARAPYMVRKKDRLECGNAYYDLAINIGKGFSLDKMVNRWSKKTAIQFGAGSGLEVVLDRTELRGTSFTLESLEIEGQTGRFVLASPPSIASLRLTLTLSVDESPQIKMNLTALNTGKTPLSGLIRFPVLRDMVIGNRDDTWVCFPKYRNVISNQRGFHFARNDNSFPMQFMDLYNPRLGIGLGLITHNLNHAPLDYTMQKNERGVSAMVEYPKEYYTLLPGKPQDLTETCLVAHAGDWRQALAAYQDWLSAWWRPVHAQDKDWFKAIFLEKAHFITVHEAQRINHTPPIFDLQKGIYKTDEALKADKLYWGGILPDTIGIGYLYSDSEQQERWGDFCSAATYSNAGGLPLLRAEIQRIQEKLGIPVSIYTLGDRCSKNVEFGKKYGEKTVRRNQDGSGLQDGKTWYVCPGAKEWQDHYVESVRKVQEDTGAQIMYLDVFGYWRGKPCYSKEHGHEVPLGVNKSTYDVIHRVREALPANVAIWSEFPVTDVNAQYTDGNIQYYFMDWASDYFARSYDLDASPDVYKKLPMDLYRFVFPGTKQIGFPCGLETVNWGGLKFLFFNGEAIMDCTWRLYNTAARALLQKSHIIKKQHVDCFTSGHPTMLVPTERAAVFANRFPGRGRTLWTLFNARPTTVRGPILNVEHQEGDVYFDAWNNRKLVPEIKKGKAIIALKLDPQGLGCVVQTRPSR